jgi:hypothetical protein
MDPLFREELERRGEASVRADVDANRWGIRKSDVLEWLNEKDADREDAEIAREAEGLEIATRAAQASERAAEASERAASAAEDSAKYTRAAAWASAVAAIAACLTIAFK